MSIHKYFIFSFLFLTLTIFTALNVFNITIYNINTIYSFVFLLTVPGILVYLIARPKISNFWERLCIVVGLSVAIIMFAGLAVNWILPLLGILKPLTVMPLTLSYSLLLPVLGAIAYIWSGNVQWKIQIRDFSILNITHFIFPIFFPIFAVMGATSLNNYGSNVFTVFTLVAIPLYIILLCIFSSKINKNIYPFSIYCISLAVLLMLSLRSWHISGTDVIQEYRIFLNTYTPGIWSSAFYHAYNACLSLTILPTVLNSFMHVDSEYIYKFYIQIIYAFAPVAVYLFTRKYIEDYLAFVGSILYISFPIFVESMVMHVRQELAFFFFAILLLTVFEKKSKALTFLSIIFGVSLVVSHYSSAYIAIILFIFTYAMKVGIQCIIFLYNKYRKENMRILKPYVANNNLNILLIVTLLLSTFLWYSVVNKSSNNFVNYIKNFTKNINSKMLRRENMTPLNQFNVNYKAENPKNMFENYLSEMEFIKESNSKLYYANSSLDEYKPRLSVDYVTPLKTTPSTFGVINISMELIKKIMKVLFVIGIFYLLFIYFRKSDKDRDYALLLLSSVFLILIFTLLPSISLDYDISRTFQQLLSFSIYPIILGLTFVLKYFNKSVVKYILTVFVLLYFGTYTHIIGYMTGGYSPAMQVDTESNTFGTGYTHDSEVLSLKWLDKSFRTTSKIHFDDVSATKRIYANIADFYSLNDSVPTAIMKNNYVYIDYVTMKTNNFYKIINGNYVVFTYPLKFLDSNKDTIYTNGDTKIYK